MLFSTLKQGSIISKDYLPIPLHFALTHELPCVYYLGGGATAPSGPGPPHSRCF